MVQIVLGKSLSDLVTEAMVLHWFIMRCPTDRCMVPIHSPGVAVVGFSFLAYQTRSGQMKIS